MKTEASNPSDPQLSSLLHEWEIKSTLPPRFSEHVWQRIASEETSVADTGSGFRDWLARLLLRPAVAFSYLTILLLVGSAAGLFQAQAKSQRAAETLSTRYVQMLDPYQMPRH